MAEELSLESILRMIRETYARQEAIDIATTSGPTIAATVYFVCKECSLPYRTIQVRRSQAAPGKKDCEDCGALVHRWSGLYNFIDWQPERPKRPTGFTRRNK